MTSTPHTLERAAEPAQPAPAELRLAGRDERRRLTHDLLSGATEATDPDERARLLHEVVLINRQVADAVASRYRNRGVPWDDLRQTAYEGLIKAVTRFDPTVRPDLLTYAVPTIRGEVQRLFRDRSWMVRPPRRIQEHQWRVNQCIDRLSQVLGRDPTREEICTDLDLSPAELAEVLVAFGCFRPPSFDQPVRGAETLVLGDLLPAADEDGHAATEARVTLASSVRELTRRDQEFLFLRFFEDLSQVEIGDRLGLTQVAVSRNLNRIFTLLRAGLGDGTGDPA